MVTEILARVIAALAANGIAATLDPPKITAPGAWVSAVRLHDRTLCGGHSVVVDVYLIARDTGIPAALAVLDGLLSDALDAADAADFQVEHRSSDLGTTITLPHGGGPLPAYKLTFIVDPD